MFVVNEFYIKWMFTYNLIIDVDIVSRTLPYRAEWASADGSYNNQLLKYWRQLLGPLIKVIKSLYHMIIDQLVKRALSDDLISEYWRCQLLRNPVKDSLCKIFSKSLFEI